MTLNILNSNLDTEFLKYSTKINIFLYRFILFKKFLYVLIDKPTIVKFGALLATKKLCRHVIFALEFFLTFDKIYVPYNKRILQFKMKFKRIHLCTL